MSILWFGLCILVAFYASHRGRSPIGWGLIAIFISPILAGIALALMKDLRMEQEIRRNSMDTDRLQERMAVSEAHIHDRMDHMEQRINRLDRQEPASLQGDRTVGALPQGKGTEAQNWKFCPQCGQRMTLEAQFCPNCGTALPQVRLVECPYCRKPVRSDALCCPYCQHDLVR